MSNKSLENVNSQFIKVLQSLNIDDNKHQKLSINLDLHKKIKTIISIQSLEERKSNVPKYLNNSRSYISLLSLSISLTTKTLYTIFCNNNGREILKNVLENSEKEKVSIAIDLVYRLIKTYNMEFDMDLLIKKACEYEKWEVLSLLDNFEIFFKGECLCQMLIYRFLHKLPDEFVVKIQQSKFKKIYEYIKNNIIYANESKIDSIKKNDNLEKILLDTLFLRNEVGMPFLLVKEDPLKSIVKFDTDVKEADFVKPDTFTQKQVNAEIEPKKLDIPPVESKPVIIQAPAPEKKVIKKKMVFKKKESTVSYINIKWSKIHKKDTIFEMLDVEGFKSKFSKEDLEHFIIKKEIKKVKEKEKELKKESPMDPKKGYALNIALSRVKIDYKEVVHGILNNDCKILNDNLVNQLLLYFPTEQELANIFVSDLEDKYVLFFKECEDCYLEVKDNLRGIKLDFLIRNFNITNISAFTKFFKDIYSSKYMKDLLGSILYLGNIVNKGSTYGGAEGFNIKDIHIILSMRISSNTINSNPSSKISDMTYKKIETIFTVKDIIRRKLPPNDVDLSIRNISYDNLINEIKEIINIKKEFSSPHKLYEDMNELYKEMIESGDNVRKRFAIDRINDEIICTLISLCDIPEKHC